MGMLPQPVIHPEFCKIGGRPVNGQSAWLAFACSQSTLV
jgi:hypothetical protein